jgi:hypothetical protein
MSEKENDGSPDVHWTIEEIFALKVAEQWQHANVLGFWRQLDFIPMWEELVEQANDRRE